MEGIKMETQTFCNYNFGGTPYTDTITKNEKGEILSIATKMHLERYESDKEKYLIGLWRA
jgi:hypothetical protein